MVNMITTGRKKPTGKSVLLYSGGMDSVCVDWLFKPDILLYVPLLQAGYQKAETMAISRLKATGGIHGELVHLPNTLHLDAFERDDGIVPNRNAHLLMLASNYGEYLWLASVEGDRVLDKDDTFFNIMEHLLNHTGQDQHWCLEHRFRVVSPVKRYTKTQIVMNYVEAGYPGEHLLTSYSCYGGKEQHCGVCKPCFRKRVALENNGIVVPGYYAADYWTQPWFQTVVPLIARGAYRGREDKDIVRHVLKFGPKGIFNP